MEQILQNVPSAIIILLIGFLLLVKGADYFVEGSSSVAKKLQVPSIIIGLTIVAMGTSLPEAAVSVVASLQGNNTLAISNVTGSNIFNLMAVIGLSAIMTPIAVQKESVKRDFPLSILSSICLIVFGMSDLKLGRIEGFILLVLFAGFIYMMIKSALQARAAGREVENEAIEAAKDTIVLPVAMCLVYIIGGVAGIIIGGDLVVDAATAIATSFGISQTLIGLTIVAIGTSLPELVTSVVAAKKNEVDMALGNAIGSNIFNILMVLGIAGVISPVSFIMENAVDIIILIVFSVIVWFAAWKKQGIDRKWGIAMTAGYIIYMVYICLR